MTVRQRILKKIYPFIAGISRKLNVRSRIFFNEKGLMPPASLYGLRIRQIDGKELPLNNLRGKKILFVNTASDCGYTGQYGELQQLQDAFPSLVIIGFPSNDFRQQEKGSDPQIQEFCQTNYGVHFHLASKSTVIKAPGQHPVYQWLTDKNKNGWNDQPPSWNFAKYLVDEKGRLLYYFDTAVSPLSGDVIEAIKKEDHSQL